VTKIVLTKRNCYLTNREKFAVEMTKWGYSEQYTIIGHCPEIQAVRENPGRMVTS